MRLLLALFGSGVEAGGPMSAIEQFNQTSLLEQAKLLSQSGIVPAAFRGKPADAFAAILWGSEVGLGPMASLMLIEPIQGTPSMKAEGRLALIRRAGHSVTYDLNDERCVVKGKRHDNGDAAEVTFSMEDAKAAGLVGKNIWKQYRQDMLFNRAVSRISRRLFSDVFLGVSYAPEEVASFAAPEMLDAQPEALAGQPQAALPAPGTPEHVIVMSDEIGSPQPPVTTQSQPRTFPAPGQSQPKNQDEFTADDQTLASPEEMRALRKELADLDETTLEAVSKKWVEAQLPSIKTRKQIDKADYERALTLVLDVKEKVAAEVAAEPFFEDESGDAA